MIRSLIAAAVLGAAALGGGQYYATGTVPFLDAPTAAAAPAPASAPPTAAAAALPMPADCPHLQAPQGAVQGATAAGLVNLNTAPKSALDALPDVGPARVARIVDARPIRSIDSLAGPGMPASVIAMLKARATV